MFEEQGCIFDFDDTLVEATIYYDMAKDRFAEKMEEFGFPGKEALEVLNRFDISNVLKCGGFHKECFPNALAQTFEYYCELYGMTVCPVTRQWMTDLGWQVFEQPVELIHGAEDIVAALSSLMPLFLATKGDWEIQSKRLEASGLTGYFKKTYIVPDKTHQEYAEIAAKNYLNPKISWVIGNSMKGDINPGLKGGFNCIHVYHRNTWDFEEEQPIGKFYSVREISEVPAIIMTFQSQT
jgi:putative hydrolase of the HAD superfamily